MADNHDKITAQDIFDKNVAIAYKDFVQLNKDAAAAIKDLKAQIVSLNAVIKANRSSAKAQRDVNKATKEYGLIAIASSKSGNELARTMEVMRRSSLRAGGSFDITRKKASKLRIALNMLWRQAKKTNFSMFSLSKGVRSLLGAAGLASLSVALIRVARSMFEVTKQLESIDLALGKVTEDTYEFGRAQAFLAKTSERLGLNLLKTSRRYTTFLAAAKNSNLTMGEANDIFGTFANVGANLALTSDEMSSIFLALEQMLSKGKVSTEELRRQLGEKLPGAMGIMARALKVSNDELETMLRKGEVIAETALPLFAEESRKAFGVDSTERIETMVSAVERLNNAWTEFVRRLNDPSTGLSEAVKGMIGLVEDLIIELEYLASLEPGEMEGILGFLKDAWDIIYDIVNVNSTYDAGLQAFKDSRGKEEASDQLIRSLDKWEGYRRRFAKENGQEVNEVDILIQRANLTQASVDAAIDGYEKFFKIKNKIGNKTLAEAIIGTPKEIDDINDSWGSLREDLFHSINRIQRIIDDPSTTSGEKTMFTGILDRMKDEYAQMTILAYDIYAMDPNTDPGMRPKGGAGFKAPKEVDQSLFITQRGKDDTAGTGDDNSRQTTIFSNISAGLGIAQEAYASIAEMENAIFERRMEQIEAEKIAINEKYENLFRLAEGDADMQDKLAIRKEQELKKLQEEEKKLAYDKAKAQKRQALIDAAINVAVGVTSALALSPAGWALAAVTAALGAVQIAAIASQPLPQYAKGTDNHPGGLAMLGDGGKNEIAIAPDGSAYMSGDKPEIVDMPKGSKVIADAKDYINQQIIKSIIDTNKEMDEIVVDKITKAVQEGFKGVKISNNNTVNNNIDFQMWRANLLN